MDHQSLFAGLERAGIDYLVTGGLALNLHGIPRLSYDVDLAVFPSEKNLQKVMHFLSGLGYFPQGGEKVQRFRNPEAEVREVDVLADLHGEFEDMRSRAFEVEVYGTTVPLMSLPDLADVKRRMGRPEDIEDLRNIEVLSTMNAGSGGKSPADLRQDQILKFQQWPLEKRCSWLVTNSQLRQGQEAKGRSGKGTLRGRAAMKRGMIKGLTYEDKS